MTRVAVIAESARVRRELGEIVRAASGLVLAATAATFEALEPSVSETDDIDVLLVESSHQTPEDFEAPVVMLSDDPELHPGRRLQRAGFGVLPTRATPEQIVAAIGAVAQGLFVLHADVGGSSVATSAHHPLTPREREVLQMLAAGLGNKAIGSRLGISEHTAKFHVAQILGKLDAACRAEAVSIAMRRGWVPL
ncbi:MAG: response regulator transcription factor [Steroidobacteraceae bacterium]